MEEKITVNDEYLVTILKQDHFGRGLARIHNMLVFVENGLPSDFCKIKITAVKKKYAVSSISEMITPSPFRKKTECPYYSVCGGCHIMHEDYQNQLQFKEQKVHELLTKFTHLDSINFFPIVHGKQFHYRNKVIFHGSNHKLGFYQEKTNQVVDISECLLIDKNLNTIYNDTLKYINDYPNSNLTKVLLRKTSLGEKLVAIEGIIENNTVLPYLKGVDTIYINHILVKGKSFITEKIDDIYFHIFPTSFFQVNYDMMLALYNIVSNFYQDKHYHKVLDLYCGTGTIGMLISKYVDQVIGVEVESSSIVSANICKELNHISNISFLEGKVEDKIDSFKEIDSIIVDPPRSGLDKYSIQTILSINPKTIIYISCDPVTLARDLSTLLSNYKILEVHPVDMFPNTYHVETVCILERNI